MWIVRHNPGQARLPEQLGLPHVLADPVSHAKDAITLPAIKHASGDKQTPDFQYRDQQSALPQIIRRNDLRVEFAL
jgi:hypothetical protein